MPMHTSLAPFRQVMRKLCLFKPSESWEPLPCHCSSRALSPDNAPLKLSYLLAHTSEWGVLEHSKILTPWATHSSWPYPRDSWSLWVEAFPTPGASPTPGSLGAFSPSAPQVPGVTPGSPLCPWCFGAYLWRGARHWPPPNGVDALIDYTRSQHNNSWVAILYGAALCLP